MTIAGVKIPEAVRQRIAERHFTIDGIKMHSLLEASLVWLRTNQQLVNSLNVFPVPDGDTGTNMVLTMQAAMDEVEKSGDRSIGTVAHAIAHGALMGARGNSGVILSQLWRGFSRAIDDKPTLDAQTFVQALSESRDTAYKGVVRPVEGTILTVSKDMAAAAEAAIEGGADSVLEILERVVEAADESVERTPDLLPVLKDAGVVDAGGKGLFFIIEGMLRSAYGLPLDRPLTSVQPLSVLALESATELIEPGQDWEVVVDFRTQDELNVRSLCDQLDEVGTSIQFGEGDGIQRLHIHVPDTRQYEPIELIQSVGTVTRVAIENLMVQLEDSALEEKMKVTPATVEPGQVALVAVSPGIGIARVFASLGAAAIIEGGQTMNPSTKEILAAFEDLPTDKVIILPNNKNIVLAAQQACELTVKNVSVVPSVTVPQGIAAMFSLDPAGDFDTIMEAMTSALDEAKTVELTTATRSVQIDGVDVVEGQVIGLLNGRLIASGDELEQTLAEALNQAEADKAELITLYYGSDLSAMHANQIADRMRDAYPDQEFEILEGGQPHYQLILAIE